MKLPSVPLALLACALLSGVGCKSPNPPAPTPRTSSAESPGRGANVQTVSVNHRGRPATNQEPGSFDGLLRYSPKPEVRIRHYLETQQPHLLKAYDAQFLAGVIQERMAHHKDCAKPFNWAQAME